MTDFDAEHVTIAGVPHGHHQPAVIVQKALARHEDPVDAVVVLVPAGSWREARDRIFEALGTAPVDPKLTEGQEDLVTAVYYEGNISRMCEGGAYSDAAAETRERS